MVTKVVKLVAAVLCLCVAEVSTTEEQKSRDACGDVGKCSRQTCQARVRGMALEPITSLSTLTALLSSSLFDFGITGDTSTFAVQFILVSLTEFVMPKSRLLASLPNEDSLYAALEKMEAKDAASIVILRKRSQHEALRNIISGLWFAILYRSVERHTGYDKAVRKASRCRAICNLTACLRAGNEISGHNNNISKVISKRMRSGVASWRTISQEPGLLAIVNFSNPPSKEGLDDLQSALEDNDLHRSANRYRTVIRRVLVFLDKTLKATESLYRYLKNALRDVIDLVNDDDVDDAATSLSLRRQDQLIDIYQTLFKYPFHFP
jgi:hypothetical protein